MTTDPSAPVRPGHELLSEGRGFLSRFIAFPSAAAGDASALWGMHTHVTEACNASPRLAALSDLPGSGKTLLMELAGLLSRNASLEADLTGPALVALMSSGPRTVLMDECDQYWNRNGGESYRQLRTIVNSGYRQGATVTRRSAGGYRKDPVFGAIAMAGLGTLPGSVLSRCVVIRMAQRKPEQVLEHYMPRLHEPLGLAIGEAMGSWARSVALDIASSWPDMPEKIQDRARECWEPLIAIADLAGGDWPERARAAAIELVLGNEAHPVLSPAQRVLSDLRTVWVGDGTSLPTSVVVQRLFALPDTPWARIWTDNNAPRELAAMLAPYGVRPVKVRDGERVCQGYRRADLARVWPAQAALPAAPDDDEVSSPETPQHPQQGTPDTPADLAGSVVGVPARQARRSTRKAQVQS